MAIPPDQGFLIGDGTPSDGATGYGLTFTQADTGDAGSQFRALECAELAESLAARGDPVGANAQIQKAYGWASTIQDPAILGPTNADIAYSAQFVKDQAPNAAQLAQDAGTADAGLVQNAIAGSSEDAIDAAREDVAQNAREGSLISQGFSPETAYALSMGQRGAQGIGSAIGNALRAAADGAKRAGIGIGIGAGLVLVVAALGAALYARRALA